MSEPGAGSDVTSMELRAERSGERYRAHRPQDVDHQRPGCRRADRLREDRPRAAARAASRAFIVEQGFAGFCTAQKLDKLGMRGSSTCELVFEDCAVPAENLLGGVNQGVQVLMSGLDYERAVLAGGPLGLMAAALDVALPYVHERKQFGQPIGTFQLMQAKIADMYASLNAARAYVYAVGRACDAGSLHASGCRRPPFCLPPNAPRKWR